MPLPPSITRRPRPGSSAFSLVEIVIALGVLTFVITALLGAFAVGMNSDRESVEELEATHILQSMIAERRANPTLTHAGYLLPPVDTARARDAANPISLDEFGRQLPGAQSGKFGLVYRVTPDAELKSAGIYCVIFWPGRTTPTNAQGRVEIATRIALP